MLDPLFEGNTNLNASITRSEVEKVVSCAKNGKTTGFDKIPYGVLKFPFIIDVLQAMFNLYFDTGILPSIWRKATNTPIPKDATKDKRIPLNYRGISLLSVVSKLYSAVLNKRLLIYKEDEPYWPMSKMVSVEIVPVKIMCNRLAPSYGIGY